MNKQQQQKTLAEAVYYLNDAIINWSRSGTTRCKIPDHYKEVLPQIYDWAVAMGYKINGNYIEWQL